MALKIASDIHGSFDAFAGQLADDDTLILCGDYIQFIDYETLDGVLAELIPKPRIASVLDLIRQGKKDEAKAAVGEIFMTNVDLRKGIAALVDRDYRRLFESLPCETYLIYGNTDNPKMMRRHLGEKHTLVETGTVEIGGYTVGLVSGMPPTPYTFGLAGELTAADYAMRLHELGPVDILITHPPAAIADLTFDTVAERDEEGSQAILGYVENFQPKWHYFGHVHQPRSAKWEHESTTMRNVSLHVLDGKLWEHVE